jgi:hypothetical protein
MSHQIMKGCTCTNTIEEGPNGRCLKDPKPKSKPRMLGGEGAKEEIKQPRKPYRGRTLHA